MARTILIPDNLISMRSRGSARHALAGALAVAAVAVPLACGDDGGGGGASEDAATPAVRQEVAFPRVSGRSFRDLLGHFRQGPVVAPSVSILEPGENRFGFALFDRGNRQIGDLDVGLYIAPGLDEMARGPYHASYNRIEVEPEFRSRNSSADPDSARSVYVAPVDFPRAGTYLVAAVTVLGGQFVAASPAQVRVGRHGDIPGVGDRAVRVHTPTVQAAGGNIETIETRVPPDSMHEVDLADALDQGRPVVLLFSSPALCESRVCGPVTDVAEQVKSEFEDDADFIHVEFYEDNELSKGPREAARAWGLTSEPILFTIDRDGTVAARIEGAFSADELRAAVRRALR
jgi:hypothetical protein